MVMGLGRAARAAEAREVLVPDVAFGAVVAAVGGTDLQIGIDPSLPLATLKAGGVELGFAERLLIKGSGEVRRRFLDDARNAPKLGAAVRDGLRTVWPELGDDLASRHKEWSRGLARQVLRWTQQLGEAGLRGKRVRDPGGRIYLLEWAGATVADDGAEAPAALARAPSEPSAPTPSAYRDYVQALVDALG
ncbi:MAG: hypothetical protein H6712_19525 [Myxococcales bacterium]|nr:hypothetical protein [Myxococcales bacterium]MCB9716067.1 hypothetical protein [Myxococcales bacterium]